MRARLILSLLGLSITVMATEVKYPVSEIPEELKKDAVAVVRENRVVFTIIAQNRARITSYYAITILNPRGNKHSGDVEFYDKLTKLTSFSASAYDANGKLIRKLKNNEIRDQSVFDGSTLFSDDRLKIADLEQNVFPYTVVFEYEKEMKFLYFIDPFLVLPDENVSTQRASLEISYPVALAPRYKLQNVNNQPEKRSKDGIETLTWKFSSVKPMKFEPMGAGRYQSLPLLSFAPTHFEFEGYVGDMDSWEEYGKWIASLNKGRDILPAETMAKVRQLTAGMKTVEEKANAVYKFVQDRSRYVGIQLGIGGYQPFEAAVVDKTGYGDCKGLSNYTVALLNAVGVKSNYVLIFAGEDAHELDVNFPSSQFNHATVCVPNGKDSLWLECTSQTVPFGYAGLFTGDRKALAITDNGGKVVRTTSYPSDVNVQTRAADVSIDAKGNGRAKVSTLYAGLQYENGHLNHFITQPYEDQKKWVLNNTEIPSFDLNSFSIREKREKIPSATITLDLTLNRLANVQGKRMFLQPNLMNRSTFVPEKLDERKTDVRLGTGYVDIDTIRYSIPEELYPEFLPDQSTIKSQFGEYHSDFKMEQGKIVYIRRMKMNRGKYPAGAYNDLIDFYKKVNKADNVKIVFLNKT